MDELSVTGDGTQAAGGRRRRVWWWLLPGGVFVLGVLLVVGGFVTFASSYRNYKVPGTSMSPTVANGDRVITVKAVGGANVHRGDTVLFDRSGWRDGTYGVSMHIAVLRQAQAAGEPLGPVAVGIHIDLAARAVPEWQATLDALQELPEIGAEGPIGFWGIMQGTGIGVPLTAVEPRITAAVFGCLGHESLTEAAAQITVPIEFLLQWDDEHVERQSGLALFDAFASKEKTLHANAGGHGEVPRFEADSATRFFARHLSRAGTSPA